MNYLEASWPGQRTSKVFMSNQMLRQETSSNKLSSQLPKNTDFQVLKPFGNSLLMIAAMTYAKNNADISTMASLEVGS